jgi:hypothetical protein
MAPHMNKPQSSDSSENIVVSPRWVLYSKTDWSTTVSRNITLTWSTGSGVTERSFVFTRHGDCGSLDEPPTPIGCDYSDNWSVWFSETVIITMLKSVAKKRLLMTKDFYVSCGYNDNLSVWFSGTVIVGCVGDP